MTFARNGSISMLIAGQFFYDEPQVLVMATLMTVGSVAIGCLLVVAERLFKQARGV